ncbi:MAG: CDP-alcohol phosphatidyltransferase family protein [Gammaproteobacteria bacterium]
MIKINQTQIPNVITLVRFFLIIPVCWALLTNAYLSALIFFIIAGVSDGIDGFLARSYHWESRFGAITDPMADKLLMISSYACLAWLHLIPMWLFLIILLRDIWILSGVIIYRVITNELDFEATRVSKINTLLQISLVAIILINISVYHVPEIVILLMIYLVLITTLSSLFDYTSVWGNKIIQHTKVRYDLSN